MQHLPEPQLASLLLAPAGVMEEAALGATSLGAYPAQPERGGYQHCASPSEIHLPKGTLGRGQGDPVHPHHGVRSSPHRGRMDSQSQTQSLAACASASIVVLMSFLKNHIHSSKIESPHRRDVAVSRVSEAFAAVPWEHAARGCGAARASQRDLRS